MSPNRKYEWESESLQIARVELLQASSLRRRARRKARATLLAGRRRRQCAHALAAYAELRVCADQRQLLRRRSLVDRGAHRIEQLQP